MAFRCFVRILLLSAVASLVVTLPLSEITTKNRTGDDEWESAIQAPFAGKGASTPETENTTVSYHISMESKPDDLTPSEVTGKLLQFASILPPETLQLLKMFAAPLMNSTTAKPANVSMDAAKVAPPEGLSRIDSFKHRAGSTLHDKVLKPVVSFVEAGVLKSRSVIPNVMNGNVVTRHFINLRNYLAARQIDRLQEEIAAGLSGLKRTLDLLTPAKMAVSQISFGPDVNVKKTQRTSAQEETTQDDSAHAHKNALPAESTQQNITSRGNTSRNVDIEASAPANGTVNKLVIDMGHTDEV